MNKLDKFKLSPSKLLTAYTGTMEGIKAAADATSAARASIKTLVGEIGDDYLQVVGQIYPETSEKYSVLYAANLGMFPSVLSGGVSMDVMYPTSGRAARSIGFAAGANRANLSAFCEEHTLFATNFWNKLLPVIGKEVYGIDASGSSSLYVQGGTRTFYSNYTSGSTLYNTDKLLTGPIVHVRSSEALVDFMYGRRIYGEFALKSLIAVFMAWSQGSKATETISQATWKETQSLWGVLEYDMIPTVMNMGELKTIEFALTNDQSKLNKYFQSKYGVQFFWQLVPRLWANWMLSAEEELTDIVTNIIKDVKDKPTVLITNDKQHTWISNWNKTYVVPTPTPQPLVNPTPGPVPVILDDVKDENPDNVDPTPNPIPRPVAKFLTFGSVILESLMLKIETNEGKVLKIVEFAKKASSNAHLRLFNNSSEWICAILGHAVLAADTVDLRAPGDDSSSFVAETAKAFNASNYNRSNQMLAGVVTFCLNYSQPTQLGEYFRSAGVIMAQHFMYGVDQGLAGDELMNYVRTHVARSAANNSMSTNSMTSAPVASMYRKFMEIVSTL